MKRSLYALVFVFALVSASRQAKASGFPGHLDELCRTAEYIVVAECVEHTEDGAKLKVETVYKAPKTDPKPNVLDVNGVSSSATRFSFEKGKRYFAFVFKGGACDRQGSHIEITGDGRLTGTANELICLEENTDTLDKLIRQVKRVLSGEYETELIARISNKELSYETRRTCALALSRTNPRIAGEAIAKLLLEISQPPDTDGSSREVFMTLLALDPNRAKELSLDILSNTASFELYFEAAHVLARPQCKLDDFQRHYSMLVEAAQEWEKINPHSGYVHMMPVFINNGCRNAEVKKMLLAELSSPKCLYFDRLVAAAIHLQFSEAVPLFWNQVKKERQVSDLVNLDIHIAQHVGASTVYDHENFERLEVWMGENIVRKRFPQYTKSLADAEVIRINKSLLFLIRPGGEDKPTCLYVGFVRKEQKKIEHKAFLLFSEN